MDAAHSRGLLAPARVPLVRDSVSVATFALRAKAGGAEGIRTPDPHNAIVVLYQLSYDPSQKWGKEYASTAGCQTLTCGFF